MAGLLNVDEAPSRLCQPEFQEDDMIPPREKSAHHFRTVVVPFCSARASINYQCWVRGCSKVNAVVKEILKPFLSLRFLIDSLSFALHIFTMSTFFLVHIDLPQDRGIEPSHAVYLIHVHSIADLVTRVLGGFIVDQGYISLECAMILSFLGGSIACEAIAWSTSIVAFVFSSLLLGASEGLVVGMMSAVVIRDFKDQSLAIMLGGIRFIIGSASMIRPFLVGK
ncbi:unnamed protein product [Ixodes hexagonus]